MGATRWLGAPPEVLSLWVQSFPVVSVVSKFCGVEVVRRQNRQAGGVWSPSPHSAFWDVYLSRLLDFTVLRLHRLHAILSVVTDVRGGCQCQSVMLLKSVVPRCCSLGSGTSSHRAGGATAVVEPVDARVAQCKNCHNLSTWRFLYKRTNTHIQRQVLKL